MAGTGEAITDPGLFSGTSQLLDLLNHVFGTQNSANSTTTNELDPNTSQLLTQFLGTIMPELSSDQYSPEAANRDAQGAVDQLFQKYRESIPSILGSSNSAGSYNSTTAQLLANDAYARTAGEASKLQIDTQSKYAALKNNSRSQITNLLLGLLAATRKTSTTNTSTNNAATNAARNAALAASALKGLTGGAGSSKAKTPPKGNIAAKDNGSKGEETKDDGSAELQKQIDANNNGEEDAPDNSQDIMSQILDSINADSAGDVNVEPIAPVDGGDVNQIDSPDFDFSDAFNGFDFSGDSIDSLFTGDTGDSGADSGDGGDTGDTASTGDIPDFTGDSGGDEEVDG